MFSTPRALSLSVPFNFFSVEYIFAIYNVDFHSSTPKIPFVLGCIQHLFHSHSLLWECELAFFFVAFLFSLASGKWSFIWIVFTFCTRRKTIPIHLLHLNINMYCIVVDTCASWSCIVLPIFCVCLFQQTSLFAVFIQVCQVYFMYSITSSLHFRLFPL